MGNHPAFYGLGFALRAPDRQHEISQWNSMKPLLLLAIPSVLLSAVSCKHPPAVTSWPPVTQSKIGEISDADLRVTWRKDIVYYGFRLVTDRVRFRELKSGSPRSYFTIRWLDSSGATVLEQRVDLMNMKPGDGGNQFEFTGHFPYRKEYPGSFVHWDFDFHRR